MADSIFTQIIQGKIPAEKLHEDDNCIVIQDINPQAPFHVLVIPKEPLKNLTQASDPNTSLLGHLLRICQKVAHKAGQTDYRVVINNGDQAGQTVPHLHLHVLAGRLLKWPPG